MSKPLQKRNTELWETIYEDWEPWVQGSMGKSITTFQVWLNRTEYKIEIWKMPAYSGRVALMPLEI